MSQEQLPTAEEIEDAIQKAGKQDWYHRFEIIKGSGVYTPGSYDPQIDNILDRLEVNKDIFKGKRILDIGAYSGAFSFFLEDCGADVVALDVYDPGKNGFNVVHSIRNSKVEHRLNTVYELNPEEFGYFDIIAFFGVFYHLRYPLLALERINSVSRNGTLLIGGGTTCDGYFGSQHAFDGLVRHEPGITTKDKDVNSYGGQASETQAVELNNVHEMPVCFFQPRSLGTGGQAFFIPNRRCLVGWIESAGFNIELTYVSTGKFKQAESSRGSRVIRRINRLVRQLFGNAEALRSSIIFKAHYAGVAQTETNDMENMSIYSIPTNFELEKLKEKMDASTK